MTERRMHNRLVTRQELGHPLGVSLETVDSTFLLDAQTPTVLKRSRAFSNGHRQYSEDFEDEFNQDSDIHPTQSETSFYGQPRVMVNENNLLDTESNEALYLREIGQKALLTPQEEIEYAQAIDTYKEAEKMIAENPHLSEEQRQSLEEAVLHGKEAWNELYTANLRLVVSVARKYVGRGVSLLDLIQEGNLGLMRGVNKYDWKRGYRFSTYAYWWVRQAVTRAVADQSRTRRLPVHMTERLNNLNRVKNQLMSELDREPTLNEIAQRMGLSLNNVQELESASLRPFALEATVGSEEDQTLADFIVDEDVDVEHEALVNIHSEKINATLTSELSEREKIVLELRFGLADSRLWALSEIGEQLNISRERVRQIEAEALRKLRKSDKMNQFKEINP